MRRAPAGLWRRPEPTRVPKDRTAYGSDVLNSFGKTHKKGQSDVSLQPPVSAPHFPSLCN